MSMDLTQRLPDDVLADVLRRLDPYDLHASRQVCSAWRAVVHDRHAHLLPLPLAGIFVVTDNRSLPTKYFAPRYSPSSPIRITISGELDADVDGFPRYIQQHCNGLLLLCHEEDDDDDVYVYTVLNPATRRWARLPPSLAESRIEYVEYEEEHMHLVFDPSMSSPDHYEVVSIKSLPFVPAPDSNVVDPETMKLEWPPSPYLLRVFSSTTSQWEEKEFIREGEAAGRLENMLWHYPSCEEHHYSVYRQGALYVHQHYFLMRINLSMQRYQVINLPEQKEDGHRVGNSEKGVYCTRSYNLHRHASAGFRVWFLDESSSSCRQMKWVLKHDIKIEPQLLAKFPALKHDGGAVATAAWSVQQGDDDGGEEEDEMIKAKLALVPAGVNPKLYLKEVISMLGFHPHNEETIFLHIPTGRVVACHLSSSRIEDLGSMVIHPGCHIIMSHPYTPCV